jgi:hypothetical protein
MDPRNMPGRRLRHPFGSKRRELSLTERQRPLQNYPVCETRARSATLAAHIPLGTGRPRATGIAA